MDKTETVPGRSQVIVDKLDHIQARAAALTASMTSLSEFLLGPRAKAEQPPQERTKPVSFVGLIMERLDDIYGLIRQAQEEVDTLRSQL